jgi:hypothetical protein
MAMFYTWNNFEELVKHLRDKADAARVDAVGFFDKKKKSKGIEKNAEGMALSYAADLLEMSYFTDLTGRIHKLNKPEEKKP